MLEKECGEKEKFLLEQYMDVTLFRGNVDTALKGASL